RLLGRRPGIEGGAARAPPAEESPIGHGAVPPFPARLCSVVAVQTSGERRRFTRCGRRLTSPPAPRAAEGPSAQAAPAPPGRPGPRGPTGPARTARPGPVARGAGRAP